MSIIFYLIMANSKKIFYNKLNLQLKYKKFKLFFRNILQMKYKNSLTVSNEIDEN